MIPTPVIRINASELMTEIKQLGSKAANAAARQVTRDTAMALAKILRSIVPVESGTLRRSIGIRKPRARRRAAGYHQLVVYPMANVLGSYPTQWNPNQYYRRRPVHYFHLVDQGAKPHIITITFGGGLMAGRTIQVRHPGTRPTFVSDRAATIVRSSLPQIATKALEKVLARYKRRK
ncbi:MAG: hypothetical protein RMJ19_05600 [Gemmatales bacterium]|nr:hypothetical protein [Gemmatales bacterium]MDW8175128.1 hypothetical protein [Gemmatales bacterium]